jgi:hypothetical protein
MATEVKKEEKKDDTAALENKVTTAIADALPDVDAEQEAKPASKHDSKDAETELFIRRLTDSVTKSIANLLKPEPTPIADDEEEVEEAGKKVRRKRRPQSAAVGKPKGKTLLERLF